MLIGIALLTLYACKKPVSYSEIPAISFQTFTKTITTDLLGNKILKGRLAFYLIDGDGNIGFNESDTTSPWSPGTEYFNNLHLTFFKMNNGNWIPDTSFNLAYRTPYIEPKGQNKTRKCTIMIDIDYEYNSSGQLPFDSIMYSFYLYDRTLNKSNTESTGLILLP
jgi:hypothetical protein